MSGNWRRAGFQAAGAPALADAGRRGSRHARGNRIAYGKPRGTGGDRAWASVDALRCAGPHLCALLRGPSGRVVARAFDRRSDGTRYGRHGRVRYPRRAVSRGAQSGQEDMIRALGLSFTVSTIALAAALAAGGAFDFGDVGASTAALAPALLGMAAGGALRTRFTERTFRRVFFGGLLLLGAHLASRALS